MKRERRDHHTTLPQTPCWCCPFCILLEEPALRFPCIYTGGNSVDSAF